MTGLTDAVQLVVSWPTSGWLLLGVTIGILLGVLPGVGPSLGMAITLPLTVVLEPTAALIFLTSMYMGGMYGGSVTAILLNVPGTAGAAATTFDGYPLARKGRAAEAIASAATASAIGGMLSSVILLLTIPYFLTVILAFGSPEYFLVAFVGLLMIAAVSKGAVVKGLIAGMFGFLISTMGIAPTSADLRYTFDILGLYDGLDFIAILLGLFAISEMLKLASESERISDEPVEMSGEITGGITMTLKRSALTVKSSLVGLVIGSIPGSGASVANFVSYAEAVRSKPKSVVDGLGWGEGNIRGVIASESSNNSVVGGSLVPTLAFGVPGSGASAILLSGLLLHGLQPGTSLFQENISVTYSLFITLFFCSLVILFVGVVVMPRAGYITAIDVHRIIPIIVVLSIVGGMTFRNNWVDVLTIVGFGVLGYYMKKHEYSVVALVLGVILGPIAERNFLRTLTISDGDLTIFLTEPLSFALIVIAVVTVLLTLLKDRFWSLLGRDEAPGGD